MHIDKHHFCIGLLSLLGMVIILTPLRGRDVVQAEQVPWKPYPILAPCTKFDERYKELFFNDEDIEVKDWPDEFHREMGQMINDYIEPPTEQDLQCTSEEVRPFTPHEKMLEIAEQLPPWRDTDDRSALQASDMPIVAVEYLRAYKCALTERSNILPMYVLADAAADHMEANSLTEAPEFIPGLTWNVLLEIASPEERMILREIATAPVTVMRSLEIAQTMTQMRRLDDEARCFLRSSVDLRNGLALSGDALVCLNRLEDSRMPVRDIRGGDAARDFDTSLPEPVAP